MNQSPIEFRAGQEEDIYTDQDRNGLLMTIGGRVSATMTRILRLCSSGFVRQEGKKTVGDVVKYGKLDTLASSVLTLVVL